MRAGLRRAKTTYVFLLLLSLAPFAFGAEGTFEGLIVEAPSQDPLPRGWIFVQGRNHMVRRVDVSHATVAFGVSIPASRRRKCGPECLEQGLEIKVTAEQDGSGEWRASHVEILRLAIQHTPTQETRIGSFFG